MNRGTEADNQLGTLFVRVAPGHGLEFFAEFGRNDRNSSVRDALVEPDHNSAWSAGFLVVVGSTSAPAFWSIRGELLDGRVTSLIRNRGQATMYEHSPVIAGHTVLGQLIGSPLLERTGGFELSADHWSRAGRFGWKVTQRLMPPAITEGTAAAESRTQWSVELSGTRFRPLFDIHARTGLTYDLNHTPGHDLMNLTLGGAVEGIGRRRRQP